MPLGPIAAESGPDQVQLLGSVAPDIKMPDVRLLSVWSAFATVFCLAVLWRIVHSCFQLCTLIRTPKLGRLSLSDGRSPRAIASHFTSVTNAVVCLGAYSSAATQRVEAASWSLGALAPLSSRPLAFGPPLPGTMTFLLSLASYCLNATLVDMERVAYGSTDKCAKTVLLQRGLLFLLATLITVVDSSLELSLAVFLLEVPSPFLALWQALLDFRLRSDPLFAFAGVAAVVSMAICRVVIFGFCLACLILHPDASNQLGRSWLPGQRLFNIFLCVALFIAYAVHLARIARDVHREMKDLKTSSEMPRSRRPSDLTV